MWPYFQEIFEFRLFLWWILETRIQAFTEYGHEWYGVRNFFSEADTMSNRNECGPFFKNMQMSNVTFDIPRYGLNLPSFALRSWENFICGSKNKNELSSPNKPNAMMRLT